MKLVSRRPLRIGSTLLITGLLFAFVAGCGTTFRRIVTPISTPSGDPQPNKTAIFMNTNPNTGVPPGTFQGSTSLIDVSGDTLIGTRVVGFDPVYMGFSINGGRVFVVNKSADSVVSYQTFTASTALLIVTSLPIGSQPNFITSNSNSQIWVSESASNKVGFLNGTIASAQIDIGAAGCTNPIGIAQQLNGKVFVACQATSNVAVINNVDNTILKVIALPAAPTYIIPSNDARYIFAASSAGISVIDANTANLITTTAIAGTSDYLFYDSRLQRVYAAGNGFVSVVDASGTTPTFADLKDVTGLNGDVRVTALADGTRFYVNEPGAGVVDVYSATSFTLTKSIAVGTAHPLNNIAAGTPSNPVSIASSSDSAKVYTANAGTHDFSIINTVGDVLVTNISAPQQDFNCMPNTTATPTCDTQVPQQVLVTP